MVGEYSIQVAVFVGGEDVEVTVPIKIPHGDPIANLEGLVQQDREGTEEVLHAIPGGEGDRNGPESEAGNDAPASSLEFMKVWSTTCIVRLD